MSNSSNTPWSPAILDQNFQAERPHSKAAFYRWFEGRRLKLELKIRAVTEGNYEFTMKELHRVAQGLNELDAFGYKRDKDE